MIEKFNEMEPKQKIMLVATIISFIILGYLVYTTFFADSLGSSAGTTAPTPTAGAPRAISGSAPPVAPRREVTQVKQIPLQTLSPEEQELLERSKDVEQQYVKLVSQFQIAQMQQRLAQTNAQIAQSKLTTVKALSEAKKIDAQISQRNGTITPPPSTQKEVKQVRALYVGRTAGRWMAMLDLDGAYFQVRVGTRLPNGSVVAVINHNGVVLRHQGKRLYLAIPTHLDK